VTLKDELNRRYDRYVFWGQLTSRADFHYIYGPWQATLRRLGAENVHWVDDDPSNIDVVQPGSWVTAMDLACKYLPIVEDCDYVPHHFSLADRVDDDHRVTLEVYTDDRKGDEWWGHMTYWDAPNQVLTEPWGSDLMAHEFMEPATTVFDSEVVHYVGSIWNDELDQGNVNEIDGLRVELEKRGIRFEQVQGVTDAENAAYVRASRINPAIAGRWQVEHGYLPCRLFKAIAYGSLGITNVARAETVLGDATFFSPSVATLVDEALSLSQRDWYRLVGAQQDAIAGYDYAAKMRHLFRAFDEVRR
jgi:hypothetical protein